MRNITISDSDAGQRFDKYLKKYLSEAQSGFIYKMLRKKNIVLNQKKASGSEKLVSGDVITLYLADDTIDKFSVNGTGISGNVVIRTDGTHIIYKNYTIDILYEDEHIAILNKPAGLLSQKAEKNDVSLVEIFESYVAKTSSSSSVQKPGICNRLDRNTSGVVACGKTLKGLQALTEAIREKRVRKYYRCVVCGYMDGSMHLSGYLLKDEKANKVYYYDKKPNDSAVHIETVYDTVKSYGKVSLLNIELITGKTHQIRAHLASCGHPLAGDIKYGAKKDENLKHYLLHSHKLCFGREEGVLCGVSGKTIEALLPQEFYDYTNKIR